MDRPTGSKEQSGAIKSFNFGNGEKVIGSDFSFTMPAGYHSLRNLAGKEIIACAKECGEEYTQSPLHIQVGRQALLFPITPESFSALMRKVNVVAAKGLGGERVECVEINGVPAVVGYAGSVVLVSIYHKAEYYQLRITFKEEFTNAGEIAAEIYNSFVITG